ncbi:ABC transporter substrate-binding protein [Egibacter rhizosphaerae]|uniref:ABC transporter substrate-binding protein n=1 Tax=Egibacter rhizosphaerae TaxID=1670831 RepID=A0A411YAU0_9ACTN|nr:ABC transporter substrate-binding protein [Egibacter rhizosphaerae]QBI18321.1 ABC transporter substrate-binding protein [Egibacter rhizosphaerae]
MWCSRTNRAGGLLALLLALALLAAACADDPLEEDPDDDPVEDDEPDEPEDDEPDEPDEPDDGDAGAEEAGPVTVGSADFPESVLLGNIYALALEEAGLEVETEFNIGAREVYFQAMQDGDIDVLPEYVGSLLNHLTEGGLEAETDAEELYADLEGELAEHDVTVLEPADAQNQNGHVVTAETAEEYDLETLSDLEPVAGELVMGGAPEAVERDDGLPGLERVYGIEFAEFVELDAGGPLTIEALETDEIDVARLFTAQPVIRENDWVLLEDDQGLVPSENLVPVVRDDAVSDDLTEALNEVSAALTLDELLDLNQRTELQNEDPDLVAEDWLTEQGIVE